MSGKSDMKEAGIIVSIIPSRIKLFRKFCCMTLMDRFWPG